MTLTPAMKKELDQVAKDIAEDVDDLILEYLPEEVIDSEDEEDLHDASNYIVKKLKEVIK